MSQMIASNNPSSHGQAWLFFSLLTVVAQYFATHPGVEMTLRLRGGPAVTVILGSARLYVSAHRQKRFVVALKYPGEEDYRYLVASEMSWRAVDIASAYTLRWLI